MNRRRTSLVFPIVVGIGALSIGSLAIYSYVTGAGQRETGPPDAGAPPVTETVPAETLFEVRLPAFVISLDEWAKQQKPEKRRALDTARRALVEGGDVPDEVAAKLAAVTDAAVAAAESAESDTDRAADRLSKAVAAVNRALASADLRFWLDSDVITSRSERVVLLFSFRVEGQSVYTSEGKTLRTLRLSRLDQLNWKYTMFGFTATARKDTVVIVDKIDERLVSTLLPALAESAPSTTVTEIVRSDLPPAVDAPLDNLVAALARRAELFAQIGEKFSERGVELQTPDTLVLGPGWKDELKNSASDAQLLELEAIENTLASEQSKNALHAAREPIATSVELHELQHSLDLSLDLPMPKALEKLAGPVVTPSGKPRSIAEHARAELSAYLAELARSPVPRLTLVQLVRFTTEQAMLGKPESYAAVVILDELDRELSLNTAPIIVNRKLDKASIDRRFAALARRSPDDLRAAAARSWTKLFSIDLPPLQPAGKQAAPKR